MDVSKLKQLKEDMGISLQGIADQSGVPMSTVTRIFRGEGNPRFDDIVAIVRVLNGSLDDLAGIVGQNAKTPNKLYEELIETYRRQAEFYRTRWEDERNESRAKIDYLKEEVGHWRAESKLRDGYLEKRNARIDKQDEKIDRLIEKILEK